MSTAAGNLIANIVLAPDQLAVRMVLFANHDAGYLTRTFPSPTSPAVTDPLLAVPRQSVGNQGAQSTYGGSLAALLEVTDRFEARLRVMFQDTTGPWLPGGRFAPLPSFTPDLYGRPCVRCATAGDGQLVIALARPAIHRERAGRWSPSSSYFYRHTEDIEDSTYGTQQVLVGYYGVPNLPCAGRICGTANGFHDQMTEELRLSFDPIHDVSGTVGAFYSRTHSKFEIPPTYASGLMAATANNTVVGPWPNDLLWTDYLPIFQEDKSVFGEIYYKFFERFNLTLGGRQYWLTHDADYTANGFMNFGPTPSAPTHNSESGFDPKVGLSYQATGDVLVYASASEGFRAGRRTAVGAVSARSQAFQYPISLN